MIFKDILAHKSMHEFFGRYYFEGVMEGVDPPDGPTHTYASETAASHDLLLQKRFLF